MKRAAVILILLAAMTAKTDAQFFAEGSFGAGYNAGTSLFYSFGETSNLFFNISPLVGYQLSEKFAAGMKASLVRQKEKGMVYYADMDDEIEEVRKAPGWSAAAFCRYKLLGSKKIALLAEFSAYISVNKWINNTTVSAHTFNQSVTIIGFNILPLFTYSLSDKWSLIASADFLSLDMHTRTEKNNLTGFYAIRNHFGFTGKTTLFNHLPEITVGFIYHFNKSSQ